MRLFLAPHNDDEALFGAYTLLRHRPLVVVVTDSWIQFRRGTGITADQRWAETEAALRILGCPGYRLGISDDTLGDGRIVLQALRGFSGFEFVYAPAVEGGHPHHDILGLAAQDLFPHKLIQYSTYSAAKPSCSSSGKQILEPTAHERERKQLALDCYPSQRASRHHFLAAMRQPETLTPYERS